MTINDIEILIQPSTSEAIEDNLSCDPARVALSKKIANPSLVASQIKYLQRARTKLPSYYAARCIFPGLSFEQASSELCAAHKSYHGRLCIDLTCGLGVDSFYLSKQFDRVVSIERDTVLAEIARINFRRLGADNITVECCSAEEFLAKYAESERADLIYVDPDRRGENNKKLMLLEECSPNVIALIETMKSVSKCVLIKNSPLFDVDQAFRLFGEHTAVEVVSLGDECKEVLIELSDQTTHPTIRTTAIGIGSELFDYPRPHISRIGTKMEQSYKYLLVPDVALQKARRAVEYMNRHTDIYIESDNGYALTNTLHDNLMARTYEIESIEQYNPKLLKRDLREQNITNIDILKREFPESTSEIAKKLGVREGGKVQFAFTMLQNHRYIIRIK